MAQITVRLSDELLEQVDRARGDVPRERWVRRALEQALGRDHDAPVGATSAPRASQPADAVPSSSASTRASYAKPFVPRPKGK